MKSISRTIFSAAMLLSAVYASAQNTYSGYFLDDYNYRFEMNPAFGNSKNMVSFPALGNVNLAMHGNLNISDVLYKLDGKTVLYTNPGISSAEVIRKMVETNRVGASPKIDILAGGFSMWGGYNTVAISVRGDVEASVPRDFFYLTKGGVTNRTYDIKDMSGYAEAYGQIAFNHSRDIPEVPGLRVGAALKVLIGIGNIDCQFDQARISLGTDSWHAQSSGNVFASMKGFRFRQKTYYPKEGTPYDYVSGGDFDDFSTPNGLGLGFDLGAEYIWNEFRFSAAVLDLGFLSWGKTQWASTDGVREFDTDSYVFSPDGDASNSLSREFDRLKDGVARLYQMKEMSPVSSRTKALGATLNFGIDYTFPLYTPLHFGLLSSTRVNGKYTWTQARLSANVKPFDFLSAGANVVVGSYMVGFGWIVNFNAPYFNLFVGMDHTMGKFSRQFIPLSSNAEFNFGINFPF